MTKRVFEGVKRFKSQKGMGTHSRGRRRTDLIYRMNAEGVEPASAETLDKIKKLKSGRRRKPTSKMEAALSAAFKARSDSLKPKPKRKKQPRGTKIMVREV